MFTVDELAGPDGPQDKVELDEAHQAVVDKAADLATERYADGQRPPEGKEGWVPYVEAGYGTYVSSAVGDNEVKFGAPQLVIDTWIEQGAERKITDRTPSNIPPSSGPTLPQRGDLGRPDLDCHRPDPPDRTRRDLTIPTRRHGGARPAGPRAERTPRRTR